MIFADRLFSLADLRIGKRKLCVLCALSPAGGTGGSSYSLFSYENYPPTGVYQWI